MKHDWSAQRLLIMALRTQIEVWKSLSKSGELSEEEEGEEADLQNDIGYAYAILNDMELSFYEEFGDTV